MSEKPEALRLAERIDLRDYYDFDAALHCPDAAIQLRRLHAENERLREEVRNWKKSFVGYVYVKNEDYAELISKRDALKTENERLREALALAERLAAGRLAMVEQLTGEVEALRRGET